MSEKSGAGLAIDAASLFIAIAALVFSVVAYRKAEFPRRTYVFEAKVQALHDFELAQEKALTESVEVIQGAQAQPPRLDELRSALRNLQVLTQQRYAADLNDLLKANEVLHEALLEKRSSEAKTAAQSIEDQRSVFERKFADSEIKGFAQ